MLNSLERRKLAFLQAKSVGACFSSHIFAERMVRMMGESADNMANMLLLKRGDVEKKCTTSLNPIIKPVGDSCNLRCRYCFNKPDQRRQVMDEEMLEMIVRQALELSSNEISFIMHGGEPLLAGMEFFESLIALQQRYVRPGQHIHNGVTTNGTLVTSSWARFFADRGFGVAISIDGPQEVHDKNRIFADGRGSFNQAVEGLRTLQAHKVDVSVLSVIMPPPEVAARDMLQFVTSLGVDFWRANCVRNKDLNSFYPEYVEELFEAWCESDGSCTIDIINEIMRGLFGYQPRDCWMSGGCHKNIGFDPDGTVSPCCEISLEPQHRFGNLHEMPLGDILQGDAARTFWEAQQAGEVQCIECEWGALCKGGCTYHRIQYGGKPSEKDYLCPVYQDTFRRLAACSDALLTHDAEAVA